MNSNYIKEYTMILEIMKDIFSQGLKNNANLEKAILTGILPISKTDLFSGLNNFVSCGVGSDKIFAEDFGFTEEEV